MQPTIRRWTALFSLLGAALLMLGPGVQSAEAQGASARLQNGGMDLHLFRPAIDSKGHLTVNGTDILGHMDFSFGLVMDYGRNILPYNGFENDPNTGADNANRLSHIVDDSFTGTLHFNLGIGNLVVVGAQLPVHLMGGAAVQVPDGAGGYTYNADARGLNTQGLGDITIHAKARILRAERAPIGLAAILRAQIPTGTTEEFSGETGFTLWPSIVAEWRPINRIRFGLELGYRLNFGDGATIPINGRSCPGVTGMMGVCADSMGNATNAIQQEAGDDLTYDDLLTFGLGASFRVAESFDIVLETYGTQIASEFGTTGAFSMEALVGFKIFVQENSYLVLAGGAGFPSSGFQQADIRGMAGFIFEPSIGDRDGDGYKDDTDQCVTEPEDFDTFADEDGCPDPDNDRDGIFDDDDECPLVPEDRDGDADEDGCPEGNEGDRDGDGILDDVDDCPDDPEDRDGFQDEDGCPDPDNDNDGILDTDDLCPNDAEDMDDFQDEDGCPDPDNDNDRILDEDDACPNDPETYNGFEDEDGCRDRGTVVIEDNNIIILEKIYFETDSAEIQQRSMPIIEAVAATLIGNPQILRVEIQGHADERGDDDYNLRLTRDRAASVVRAVTERGVESGRVRSAGYGERCPVDPRHNAEAWDQNRRVEFKILETTDGPTGVEVACPAGRDLIPN